MQTGQEPVRSYEPLLLKLNKAQSLHSRKMRLKSKVTTTLICSFEVLALGASQEFSDKKAASKEAAFLFFALHYLEREKSAYENSNGFEFFRVWSDTFPD